jgi:predicted flap endonuclease-1-like 5' DNA nuclease
VETKLQGAKITTTDELVKATATAHGRAELAKTLGVEPAQLTEWINRADLMRLKGVGTEMANLLEDCGVDSAKELQHRVATHLHAKLKEVNDQKHITNHAPSEAQVEEWITEAKALVAQG